MMNSKIRIIILLALLGIELMFTAWFYCIEAYPDTRDIGWQEQVRINPYYSAEKYLEATGSSVTTIQKLTGVDDYPAGTTLLISNASQVVTSRQADELFEWLNAGGNIIITAPRKPQNDPLLADFDLSWYDYEPEEEDEEENLSEAIDDALNTESAEDEETAADQNEEEMLSELITELHFNGIDETLEVDFDVYNGLRHPYMHDDEADTLYQPIYWASNDYGAQFIQFEVGSGLLTVITDDGVFDNNRLQDHDHAFLLTILIGPHNDLVILHSSDVPHLLQLIWRAAPAFCFSLLVLLAMWLLLKASRFGPRYQVEERQRRSLNDHLRSEPQYLWQIKQFEQLNDSLLNDLKTCLVKRGHNLHAMSDNAIFALVQERTGVDLKHIFDELSAGKALGEKRFVEHMQTLQALRKQL